MTDLTDEEAARVVAKDGKGCGPAIAVRLARALLQARADAAAAQARKTFPILKGEGAKIDYQLVADHAEQARANHYQTVERLAERGGLSWCELYAVLHNRKWEKIETNEAMIACRALEARYLEALAPDAGTAELARLKGERDAFEGNAKDAYERWVAERERADTLAASLAAQTALVQTLTGALDVYEDALTEAEAIFGGEYGDHYGPMCEMAFAARNARRAALSPAGEAGQ